MTRVGTYDISDKPETFRTAITQAIVRVSPSTVTLVNEGKIPKGNIFDGRIVSVICSSQADLGFIAVLPSNIY